MTTRIQAEKILVRRVGVSMEYVGLDGTAVDGNNADLNDPIGFAVRFLGGTTADPSAVTSAEVEAIAADDTDALLDLAEYRTLSTIISSDTLNDLREGPHDEKFNQFFERIQMRAKKLEMELENSVGFGLGTIEPGVISLDFAEHVDESRS